MVASVVAGLSDFLLVSLLLLVDLMLVGALLARVRRRVVERRRARHFRDELTPQRLDGLERFVR